MSAEISSDKNYKYQNSLNLLDYVPDGMMVINSKKEIIFWNACLEDWTDMPRSAILGKKLTEVFPHLAQAKYESRLDGVLAGGPPVIFSSQLHTCIIPAPLKDGQLRIQHTVVTPAPAEDGTYNAIFAIQDVTDITRRIKDYRVMRDKAIEEAKQRQMKEEELKILSMTDALTGLANRRRFFEVLGSEISRFLRYKDSYLSLAIIDLDDFKEVNDKYGHPIGDAVLITVSNAIKQVCRKSDLAARYGGDEFIVILTHTPLVGAINFGQRVLNTLNKTKLPKDIRLNASIGITVFSEKDDIEGKSFLARADQALYIAKQSGKNQVKEINP